MGSAYVPSSTVESQLVGNTSISNPQMLLSVNGTTYANGFRVTLTGGYRNFFLSYNASTGDVYIVCHTICYGADLPEYVLSNVEVLIIG